VCSLSFAEFLIMMCSELDFQALAPVPAPRQ
jgi:hypothetical protein